MPCAAVVSMPHMCPMTFLTFPHVGGVISMGSPNVFISNFPAARVGDQGLCMGFGGMMAHPVNIIKGSSTVFIGGQPAAFMSSNTSSGGMVLAGIPTVQIGM